MAQTKVESAPSARRERRSGFLVIHGARLESRWVGPRPNTRPTLVFLHEGLGCVALWKNFPDRLVGRTGLGAFVYSRQGYGRSDPIAPPRAVDYLHREALDVLPKVLDAAGIERAVLIGHSDGGSIALIHAASGRADRIAGLAVIATHVFNEEVTVRGVERARIAFESGDLRNRLARSHGDNVDGAFWGWNQAWLSPEFRAWTIEECLPRITAPVLVLQGEDDHYGTPAQVEAIARGVSGPVETVILPECGHSPHLEKPEETLEAIARFVSATVEGATEPGEGRAKAPPARG